MTIQNINMSVPVGVPRVDNSSDEDVASEAAEVQQIIHNVVAAWQSRCRPSWKNATRRQRRLEFDRDMKAAVKRLSVSVASVVEEREARASVRVRVYSDLRALVDSLEHQLTAAERRHRNRWRWMLLGFGAVFALTAIIAFFLVR